MNPLAFEDRGPSAAPAVLFIHGFMGSRRDWAAVTATLSRKRRCIAVDLPGHGATADPGNDPRSATEGCTESLWTPEGCVAALAGLLAATGGGSVVGYSLGGRLALQLAVEHPGLVSRTVIISASPGIVEEAARRARRDEDEHRARRLETQGLEPFLEDWYRQPLFTPLREHPGYPAVLVRRRRNDPRLLARSLRTMGAGSQRSLWGDLAGLRTPLLFLAGERDPKFTALALAAVAHCRQAEAVVLRGRGHALVEEDPEAVVREAAKFLAGDEHGATPG